MQDSSQHDTLDRLKVLFREAAASRFRHLTKADDVQIVEHDARPRVFAHWMALILVAGPQLRLTLKVHFMSAQATALMARSLKVAADSFTPDQVADFMKEYCNLAAGKVKIELQKNGIETGISLPLVTRGFDEVFFRTLVGTRAHVDDWKLASGGLTLALSAIYETFSDIQITDQSDKETESGEGDVDFL